MKIKKISFGRIFWPSLLASSIVALIIALVTVLLIGGLFPDKPEYSVKTNSILHMQLNGNIRENSKIEINPGSLTINHTIGLADVLYGIKKAKEDQNIKGIFLEVDNLSCGYASASEIRKALNDFQNSGKFIQAYNKGEVITLKEYYLSSVASSNYGFPSSMMEFGGLGAELMYYKNMLDKLDVEMQVIRGKNNDFKSAVEPYFRNNMSDSSRLQTETFLSGIWKEIKAEISNSRSIAPTQLDKIADSTFVRRASDAVKYKLLDGIKYRDEVLQDLATRVSLNDVEDLSLVKFDEYAKKKFYAKQTINRAKKANVAVILAEGEIATTGAEFSSNEIVKLFIKVRLNDDIETVIFRV
ncbi:MAG: S49 family peptidase, partial [Lishizhenia sp.]